MKILNKCVRLATVKLPTFKRWPLLMLSILATTPCFANGGNDSSGGGSVVRDSKGNYIPADVYFKLRGNKLPYGQKDKFDLSKDEKLLTEIGNIEKLLKSKLRGVRSDADLYLLSDIKYFEIYFTSNFLGQDTFDVGPGKTAKQIAYTYRFVENTPSGQIRRKIIELSPLFAKQSTKIQALILVHEWLHHGINKEHTFISPVIADLYALLDVYEKQQNGGKPILSNSECHAAKELDENVSNLFDMENSIHEKFNTCEGGGEVIGVSESNFDKSNYVSLDSQLAFANNETRKFVTPDFFNNNHITGGSRLTMDLSGKSRCYGNIFDASSIIVTCDTDHSVVKKVTEFTERAWLVLNGQQNRVENLRANGKIILEGNVIISHSRLLVEEPMFIGAYLSFEKSSFHWKYKSNWERKGHAKSQITFENLYLTEPYPQNTYCETTQTNFEIAADAPARMIFDANNSALIDLKTIPRTTLKWKRAEITLEIKTAKQFYSQFMTIPYRPTSIRDREEMEKAQNCPRD